MAVMDRRIAEEMAGEHIFVTGGTGFMGKVLIEKLLRSCPDLACIYVLMRPKKGLTVEERLDAILKSPLFGPLLKENPKVARKLRPVAGDCSELRLGLGDKDVADLVQNVSFVFHAAATVRFDDPLQSAILLNTRGTREVVELCKKMPNLKVLQYVSTTYSFTKEPILKEEFYRSDWDWRTMIRLAEMEDQETLNAISHKILASQPNTYTFSKALSEDIINDARSFIPATIFRPAVVMPTIKEPIKGWLENFNGPFGIWIGAMKGVLRISYGNPQVALSFTPVDWAIRGMILCACAKAVGCDALRNQQDQLDVVNMEGSIYDRTRFIDQQNLMLEFANLSTNPIRYPRYSIGTSYLYFWLVTVLSTIPYALAVDALLRMSGRKPRLMGVTRKSVCANHALAYFMLNEFPIESSKINVIHYTLREEDRPIFGVDLRDPTTEVIYDRLEYSRNTIKGAYKFVLNEEVDEEKNQQTLKRLYILEITLNAIWAYLLYISVGKFFISKILQLFGSISISSL